MYLSDGAVTAIVLTGGYYYSSYPFFFHLYLGGVGCSRFARCGADLRSARTLRLHTSNKVHIDNGVASRHIENGITNRPEPLCLHLLEQAVRRVPASAYPRTGSTNVLERESVADDELDRAHPLAPCPFRHHLAEHAALNDTPLQ